MANYARFAENRVADNYYLVCRYVLYFVIVINFYIFAKEAMRRYKVHEVIALLLADGWYLAGQRGSHRQFKHPQKTGRVTVNEKPSATLDQEILNSIWKQAGWK